MLKFIITVATVLLFVNPPLAGAADNKKAAAAAQANNPLANMTAFNLHNY